MTQQSCMPLSLFLHLRCNQWQETTQDAVHRFLNTHTHAHTHTKLNAQVSAHAPRRSASGRECRRPVGSDSGSCVRDMETAVARCVRVCTYVCVCVCVCASVRCPLWMRVPEDRQLTSVAETPKCLRNFVMPRRLQKWYWLDDFLLCLEV